MARLAVAVGSPGGLYGADINAAIFGSANYVASFIGHNGTGGNGVARAEMVSGAFNKLYDASGNAGVFGALSISSIVRRPTEVADAIGDVAKFGLFPAARCFDAASGGPNVMSLTGVSPNWTGDFGFAMVLRTRGTGVGIILGRQASGTSRACLEKPANSTTLRLWFGAAFVSASLPLETWALVLGGRSGSNLQLQALGVRSTDVAVTTGDGASGSAFLVGAGSTTGTSPFNGDFKDVVLFSKSPLDSTMIKERSALQTKASLIYGIKVGF